MWLLLAGQPSRAAAQDAPPAKSVTLVEIEINGSPTGVTALVLRGDDGKLLLEAAAFDLARIKQPAGQLPIDYNGQAYLPLPEGMSGTIDETRQALMLDTSGKGLQSNRLDLGAPRPKPTVTRSAAFLNYDLLGQAGDTGNFVGGQFETVMSGNWGLVTNSFTATTGGGRALTRLDTTYVHDFGDGRTRLSVGDGIVRDGASVRPLRFGGIQFGTAAASDAGFFGGPTTSFRGEARLPSTVELYVDDTLRYRGDIQAGPFSIDRLPVMTGAGTARIVVRDPLGREQAVDSRFYVAPQLLSEGVEDYSYTFGFDRRNYNLRSFSYGTPFVAGLHRFGLDQSFTLSVDGAASTDRQTAGISAAWLIPEVGVLEAAGAAGNSRFGTGYRTKLAASRDAGWYSLNASWMRSSDSYFQIGDNAAAPVAEEELQVGASLSLGRYGNLAGSYARVKSAAAPSARITSLQYNIDFGFAFAGAYASLVQDTQRSTLFGVSLTIPLGRASTATSEATFRDSHPTFRQTYADRPTDARGFGYRASVARGETRTTEGELRYDTGEISLGAAAARSAGKTAGRLSASGALALFDGHLLTSRRIDDAFAIVEVPGRANVPVLLENQPVAVTDSAGYALVPGLLGYQANRIRVETQAIDITQIIQTDLQVVVPRPRSAATVQFKLATAPVPLLVSFVDGKKLPPGAQVTVENGDEESFVGMDGEVYLQPPGAGERILVKWAEGSCIATAPTAGATVLQCK